MSHGEEFTTDPDAERRRIRERKRRELRRRIESGDGTDGESGEAPSESRETDALDAPAEPIAIDGEGHLRETTGRYDVVLVDCYAEWCGPCRMMKPALAAVAAETDAAVATIDIDRHRDVAASLGARSVPTLVLYVDGEPVERLVGAQNRGTLEALIERYG